MLLISPDLFRLISFHGSLRFTLYFDVLSAPPWPFHFIPTRISFFALYLGVTPRSPFFPFSYLIPLSTDRSYRFEPRCTSVFTFSFSAYPFRLLRFDFKCNFDVSRLPRCSRALSTMQVRINETRCTRLTRFALRALFYARNLEEIDFNSKVRINRRTNLYLDISYSLEGIFFYLMSRWKSFLEIRKIRKIPVRPGWWLSVTSQIQMVEHQSSVCLCSMYQLYRGI